jgi:3D (Asp-Asp-Asp) domain-containing protein
MNKKDWELFWYISKVGISFILMELGVLYYLSQQEVNETIKLISPIGDDYKYKFIVEAKELEPEIKIAKVTAYSCGGLTTQAEIDMNCPSLRSGKPRTANGTEPIPNKTMACDPANMGKTFKLDINDGIMFVCTDAGSAIVGSGRFDIYLETVEEAREFGVQYIEYSEVDN